MGRTETAKIRLYVEHPLGEAQSVPLSRVQAHYLFGVMRQGAGDAIKVFNGSDGEWLAKIEETGKRGGLLRVERQTRCQNMPPDVWLVFAPVKKSRTDFIVEKAVELGVSAILPVQTEFTNSARIQHERLQMHAVEAAEQCGATFVPQVAQMARLDRLLAGWDTSRALLFCDEARAGDPVDIPQREGPWAVFVGPEGGFSDTERNRFATFEQAYPVALGPRILRADTAAVAALALWQARLGDWRI